MGEFAPERVQGFKGSRGRVKDLNNHKVLPNVSNGFDADCYPFSALHKDAYFFYPLNPWPLESLNPEGCVNNKMQKQNKTLLR
jgi:hypothetical protein